MEDKIKTIEEFYKTQDIDEQFDEVEYAKLVKGSINFYQPYCCLLYTSPSPRDVEESRMPSSA